MVLHCSTVAKKPQHSCGTQAQSFRVSHRLTGMVYGAAACNVQYTDTARLDARGVGRKCKMGSRA
eukprot:1159293-Pelagomonas_calceolata.AAC.2